MSLRSSLGGIFLLSPLVAYVGTFRRQWGRGSYAIWGYYYAGLVLGYLTSLFVLFTPLLDALLVVLLILVVMAGPLVAMCVLAVSRIGRVGFCHRCEYDLTGNTSGRCPECGEAVDDQAGVLTFWQRMKGLAWRKFLVVYGVLCLLLCFVVCYTRVDRFCYCSECCVTKCETAYEFCIPGSGLTFLEIDGPIHVSAYGINPLTPQLDPEGTCKHKWMKLGHNSENLFRQVWASGYTTVYSDVVYNSDFAAFLADRPGTLERIRGDLRRYESYDGWLGDEYDEWKAETKGRDSSYEGDGSE